MFIESNIKAMSTTLMNLLHQFRMWVDLTYTHRAQAEHISTQAMVPIQSAARVRCTLFMVKQGDWVALTLICWALVHKPM